MKDAETDWPEGAVFTLGHSTLPIEQFVATLEAYGIECLADIRTLPRSRYNPQFNEEALDASLAAAGIHYVHMKALGGLRRARADSPNTGWRNGGFRGYADYMMTEDFKIALAAMMEMRRQWRVALMCAESVPWRCHRSLVADALSVRGVRVVEIFTPEKWRWHELTRFARMQGEDIVYPPEQAVLL